MDLVEYIEAFIETLERPCFNNGTKQALEKRVTLGSLYIKT